MKTFIEIMVLIALGLILVRVSYLENKVKDLELLLHLKTNGHHINIHHLQSLAFLC